MSVEAGPATDAGFEVVELSQPYDPDVLYLPQPPFSYEMTLLHERGEVAGQLPGASEAVDRICAGLHIGTHIDSLSHIAMDGRLHDGTDVLADGVQDRGRGIALREARGLRPIVAPGVLLDFPSHLGCRVLEDGHAITVAETLGCAEAAGAEIGPGTVVLFRTGFDLLWDEDPERYLSPSVYPGPEIEVARTLRERGVLATGSDTPPYERYPSDATLSVHVELLVRGGIFIVECLRLQELAQRGAASFQFIALPLNMARATASPVSPVAIVPAAPA